MNLDLNPKDGGTSSRSDTRGKIRWDFGKNRHLNSTLNYRKPKQIGFYSLDEDKEYVDDSSEAKYLFMPKNSKAVSFDLNIGYEDGIRRDFDDEGMDPFLEWVLGNKKLVLRASKGIPPDFICYRGLLTTIMSTPYEKGQDWTICAIKYKGIIFLCKFNTDTDIQNHLCETERQKLMCAWGTKFEQYMMSEKMGQPPNLDQPVNEKTEYNCVVRSRIGNHSLIIGAEVDGLDTGIDVEYPQETGYMDGYMELKTSRIITHPRQKDNFARFKLLKWWCQSYLVGIKKIYCGFRDDQGIVRKIELYKTDDIPRMGQSYWKPIVCLNYWNDFLSHVKSVMSEDDPRHVYKFSWAPGQTHVTSEKVTDERFRFLKDWFIQKF